MKLLRNMNPHQTKKDLEIMMLQARLEQTEKTMQQLIGQMGMLTASLAGAGLTVKNIPCDPIHNAQEEICDDDNDLEEDSDDEDDEAIEEEEEDSVEEDSDDDSDEDDDEDENDDEKDDHEP